LCFTDVSVSPGPADRQARNRWSGAASSPHSVWWAPRWAVTRWRCPPPLLLAARAAPPPEGRGCAAGPRARRRGPRA